MKMFFFTLPQLNYAEVSGTLEVNLSVYWGNNYWLESTTRLIGMYNDDDCYMLYVKSVKGGEERNQSPHLNMLWPRI